jgi:hypothetical protein
MYDTRLTSDQIDIIVLGKDAPALPEPKTLADRVR